MDQRAVRSRGYIVVFSLISLIVGGVIGYSTPRPAPSVPVVAFTPPPTALSAPTCTPSPIRVHVTGAVRAPAVYNLPPGSIVRDALAAAGGSTPDANLEHINLALELRDHQQIYISHQGEVNPPPPISGGASGEVGEALARVNINTATLAELESLPRIGPTTAQRIIEYREANGLFQAPEDIQNVPGIGTATFDGIKDLITVGQ